MKFGAVDNLSEVDFVFPIAKKGLGQNAAPDFKSVNFYFGASVWADKKYVGKLFPTGTKQVNFLSEYAKQFNSIEVNATRYGVPKLDTIKKWRDTVGDDFIFSMKFPQVITHRKDMNDAQARQKLDDFLVALNELGPKNGVAFAVMPGYFRPDRLTDLVSFFKQLPSDMRFAVELRAEEWFTSAVVKSEWAYVFKTYNIIPVLTDTPGRRDVLHFERTNDHLFVRYVGNYDHPSDSQRIDQWIERLIELIKSGTKNIWFYTHQPSDNRAHIVDFYIELIQKINTKMGLKLPSLTPYHHQVLF